MHELAIAEAIVAVVTAQAHGRRVGTIHVRVGHLRPVVPAALAFGFDILTQRTPLESAVLRIEEVPVEMRCGRCAAASPRGSCPFRCPACGAPRMRVVRGEELLVASLELAADPGGDRGAGAPDDAPPGAGAERSDPSGEPR